MKKRLFQILGIVMVTVLVMSSTTACFEEKTDKETNSHIEFSEESETTEKFSSEAVEEYSEEEGIVVTTAEEFVEAIAPDTTIVVNASYLNLTEYIAEIWELDRESWNADHEYVQIEECYDGALLVIQNTDGLVITGATEQYADTEIVVEPRYADCLKFVNCNNITLSYMTIGHTDQGDCEGDVLTFLSCQGIYLDTMDLYGCGVYAISALEGSGEFTIENSVLRDCCNGAFEIWGAEGGFYFTDCTLTGSLGIPYFDGGENSWIEFYGCTFGQRETEGLFFSDAIYADEDCVWSEDIEYYPEYGYDGEEYYYEEDFENEYEGDEGFMDLSPINFKAVLVEGYDLERTWDGMFKQDLDTDNITFFTMEENDYANVIFRGDGTGEMDLYGSVSEFTWERMGNHTVKIYADGQELLADFFEQVDDEGMVWMKIQMGDTMLWFS